MWAIVELMGRVRRAGRLDEMEIAGTGFIRLRIPDGDDTITQFISPGAVYAITPTTEATARAAAAQWRPEPVQAWELERPAKQEMREAVESAAWAGGEDSLYGDDEDG